MNLDIFETRDARYLVNGLQTVFEMATPVEMCLVEGKPGRMIYDETKKACEFQPGAFCQNKLCNLRVLSLLDALAQKT
ncbi:MAG: hypothetical protein KAV87_50930 [Desulfobacteraceae bacterium]|nr:hypothetical protein [Desulfobacteraceae bacterium]